MSEYKLPVLADLLPAEKIEMMKKQSQLQVLLNQEPPKAWIDVNKYAGNSKSLSIGKIQFLLTKFFLNYRTEVRDSKILANSVAVTVRVFVQDPVTLEWRFNDGIGAVPIKTDKGANPSDLSKIKNDAIQTGLPAAKAYAFKNACKEFGVIFGRDLNRDDFFDYSKVDLENNLKKLDKFKNIN